MAAKSRRRFRRPLLVFLLGFVSAIMCFLLLNLAMAPVSTSEYCGSECHEMNELYRTWEVSAHGANDAGVTAECVDCHLPPKEQYFRHLFAKAYAGGKDMWVHTFGAYDGVKARAHVETHLKNETCLHCHTQLLKTPSSSSALKAHQACLFRSDDEEERSCLECHSDLHERENKLFSRKDQP